MIYIVTAIGGLAIALANDGKLEEAQQELDTLQKKGASSGDRDLVAAEILSLQKNYDQALALYTKVFNEVEDPQLLSHAYHWQASSPAIGNTQAPFRFSSVCCWL